MKVKEAILQIQREVSKVVAEGDNTHLKSKYATLEDTLDALNPSLKLMDLIVTQFTRFENNQWVLVTRLETDDDSLEFSMPLLGLDGKNPMQCLGSALTYSRRYSLHSIFKLCSTDDDGVQNRPDGDTSKPARKSDIEKMLRAFAALTVTKEEIENRYQCDSESLTVKNMEELREIHKQLKDKKIEKIAVFGGDEWLA